MGGPVPPDAVGGLLYPHLRETLRHELRKLADRSYQQRVWLSGEEPGGGLMADDVMDVAERLFGEVIDLAKPEDVVGVFVHAGPEVEALRALGTVLDPLLDRLGARPWAAYLADPVWDDVVRLAGEAERVLAEGDGSKD